MAQNLKIGELSPDDRIYSCSKCKNLHAMKMGETATACEICKEKNKINEWKPTKKEFIIKTRNVAKEIEKRKTTLDKISDKLTASFGTTTFLLIHLAWFTLWILINTENTPIPKFDPYPFGLLTTIVSLEAIFLAIFILISQNRASQVSELRSELDYQVDVKSEKRTAEIHAMLQEMKK